MDVTTQDQYRFGGRNYDENAQWEVLNDLIGRIYECALEPTLWNETLSRISDALCPLNWGAAFLIWEGNSPPRAEFVAASGLAAGVQEMYATVYGGNHEWSRRLMGFRNGSVVDTDEVIRREEFIQTKFAREFLLPWGINRMLAVILDRRGGERLGLIFPGPGDVDLGELRRGLRVLAPHIQRAIRISHRIASLDLAASAAAEATDRSPFAVLSLDADLNILSANAKAAKYAHIGAILTANDRFAFAHPAAQQRLFELARSDPPTGLAFHTVDAKGREHPVLGARIEPKKALQMGGIVEGAALIISIGSARGETPVVEINRVAQWFGLTPSEARLAHYLAQGMSLQDYAAWKAVSVNSTRFLLKGVFRKTGATSQAQLASIIAHLPTG